MVEGKSRNCSHMKNSGETFDELLKEISQELKLEPRQRGDEYAELTLKYFLKRGRSSEEHTIWRECHMHEEMSAILSRRFLQLNPHIERQIQIREASEQMVAKDDQAYAKLVEYEQEIDLSGNSQRELDDKAKTKQPKTSRKELELQAAENYIFNKWQTRSSHADSTTESSIIEKLERNKDIIPEITFAQLKEELEKEHYSQDAIRKAIERAIKDSCNKKKKLPWEIGGCASEYQITAVEPKESRTLPTPRSCKYQKKQTST